jgi:hypothetical protein
MYRTLAKVQAVLTNANVLPGLAKEVSEALAKAENK